MFIKTFINKANLARLAEKGFSLNPFADKTDKHRVVVYKAINQDLFVELLFQKRGTDQTDVTIFLSSKSVTSFLTKLNQIQPSSERVSARPVCLLAVDLAWLVWNKNPASWQKDQYPYYCKEHSDISKILSDYDEFGVEYVASMANRNGLAFWLSNLNSYPVKVNVPGGLCSANPFVYSALLYLAQGDIPNAEEALNKGTAEYQEFALEGGWRQIKFDEFSETKLNILSEIKKLQNDLGG